MKGRIENKILKNKFILKPTSRKTNLHKNNESNFVSKLTSAKFT